jgi:hypothetical protein
MECCAIPSSVPAAAACSSSVRTWYLLAKVVRLRGHSDDANAACAVTLFLSCICAAQYEQQHFQLAFYPAFIHCLRLLCYFALAIARTVMGAGVRLLLSTPCSRMRPSFWGSRSSPWHMQLGLSPLLTAPPITWRRIFSLPHPALCTPLSTSPPAPPQSLQCHPRLW